MSKTSKSYADQAGLLVSFSMARAIFAIPLDSPTLGGLCGCAMSEYIYIYIYINIYMYMYTYIYIYTYINTLHYITLHYITLHYINTYITLHSIPFWWWWSGGTRGPSLGRSLRGTWNALNAWGDRVEEWRARVGAAQVGVRTAGHWYNNCYNNKAIVISGGRTTGRQSRGETV